MSDRPRSITNASSLSKPNGAIVSVTRFRARSSWVLPLFVFHAHRSIAQLRKAEGYLDGAVRQDAHLVLWTMTVWQDQRAIQAYVTSGAHHRAMPHLRNWGEEAGAVRWAQDRTELPDWDTAERRLREEGHASDLRRPGPAHLSLSFSKQPLRYSGRL